MNEPINRRSTWTPPRKLLDGKPLTFGEILRATLDLHRSGDVPLWQSFMAILFMAWTTPTTRSTSELITASIWNTDLVDNLIYLKDSNPAARVYHNTTQSMTLATDNPVLFNSEAYDNDTIHDTGSNTSRLTCQTAGVYQITGNFEWTTIPATATVTIRLNGSTVIAKKNMVSTDKTFFITTSYKLAAADYVEFCINPVSTQTLTGATRYGTEGMMHRVSGG